MRRLLVLGAAATMAALGLVPAATPAQAIEPALTFGVPRIVDPVRLFSEPDIKVGANGVVQVSGPQGTGVQRSVWDMSVDGGESWRTVQGLPDKQALGPNKSSAGPGGGDTEILIARDGRTYFSDLWSLTCFTAATTTDNGATVDSNPDGCSHPPADRQWMAAYYPPDPAAPTRVYQVYDGVYDGDRVDMTTDGLTYTNVGLFADTTDHFVVNGNLVVDQPTAKVLGIAGETAPAGKFGLALAVGTPDATGQLSFAYHTISDALNGDPQTLFPVLAQDRARNLYAVWAEDCDDLSSTSDCWHVFYSWASPSDGWTKWSAPRRVDRPPSATNVMPWVAAGGNGIVDIVWYGTTSRVSPSAQANQAWDVYLSQVTNANTSAPVFNQAKVTPHPMHYNDICLLGTACITEVGNRNLADFFQVAIDQSGRARVVYPDTSNNLIQANEPLDHPGAALVTVATQNTGRNAWNGNALTALENTAPVAARPDASGDALFPSLGGTNVPGLDITKVQLATGNGVVHVKVTTAAGTLASGAQAAGGTVGQLVVRWQSGTTLSYAAVEQDAAGGPLTWYAGQSQTVDLCSVSACKPNYLTYPAPPAGGNAVTGTVTGTGPVTYDIVVPITALGGAVPGTLLEEVTAFSFAAPTSARVPLSDAQAFADEVPLVIDGMKTFNFRL